MLQFVDVAASRGAAQHRDASERSAQRPAVRRSDQHPVHQRHDRLPKGRDADPPQHPEQRLLRRRARCGSPQQDRLCIPVPLYHCFGMVMGNLGCVTHGATMVYPGRGFEPLAVLEAVAGRALHRAATACRRCSSPSSSIRTSRASISRACAPASWRLALSHRGDEARDRRDAHERGHDRLRHDGDQPGQLPDRTCDDPLERRVATVGQRSSASRGEDRR